jgi:glucose-6-phosphate isomerase
MMLQKMGCFVFDPALLLGVSSQRYLPQPIIPELESKTEPELGHDSSADNPIRRYRKEKEARAPV